MQISPFKSFNYVPPISLAVNKNATSPVEQPAMPLSELDGKKFKGNSTRNVLVSVGFCAAAIGGIMYAVKSGKLSGVKDGIAATGLDSAYKEKLVLGLKNTFGVNVKPKSLKSIIGPDEFMQIIGKYKSEHYRVGLQEVDLKFSTFSDYKENFLKGIADSELETFYKNAIDGNFRISLHTHSNFSDGKASVEEFLECARKYADKVAKKKPSDGLPPFTIALTDHDNVEGSQEIIKLIAKNPNKYKNLKFVAGCEFSVDSQISGFASHHDITGLALNPFDENLNKMLNDLRESRRKIVSDFLSERPPVDGKQITFADLIEWEKSRDKKGKRTLQNGSGIVSVRHAVKYYFEIANEKAMNNAADDDARKVIKRSIKREMGYLMDSLGDTHILPIKKVVSTIQENGGHASLTHPLKSFWGYIGDEHLSALKSIGINGIEVNHQYTPSKIYELKKNASSELNANDLFNSLTEQYSRFAAENNMFLSGGTDSHELQIFSREPSLKGKDKVLNKILN